MRHHKDEKLKQIAKDFLDVKIFSNFHLNKDRDDLMMHFYPLIFMTEELRKKILDEKPMMIYEYYDKAGPRGINGKPIFMSMSILFHEDFEVFLKYHKVLIDLRKEEDKLLNNLDINKIKL